MAKSKMSNSVNCIVVIVFVNVVLVLQPVASAIDVLVQDYLNAEKNLWHLVRSTNEHNNDDALAHIYETHEYFLAMNFNEIGQFDALSKQERKISDENRIIERHLRRIVNGIQHINVTTLNTQRILSNKQYEYLPNMMKDITQNMPKMIGTLCKYTDTNFWLFVKNVKKKLQFFIEKKKFVFFSSIFLWVRARAFIIDFSPIFLEFTGLL